MTTCAEAFATAARAEGIACAFGHPGGEIVDLMEACEGAGIEFVLTGHESAAAFMAGAVGRLTGRPGLRTAGSTISGIEGFSTFHFHTFLSYRACCWLP